MAVTQNSYIGNGSTTNYSFTFPYLKTADVKAQIDATVTTAFTLANATTVQFNTAPASGAKIKIYRETDDSALNATFYAGSALKSEDLNDNFTQNLYSTQEVTARYLSNLGGTMVGDMTMAEDVDIIFEGATDDAYETRLTVADPTADRTITLPNVTGNVITTGDTGTVTSTMLADGTIATGDLANNAVTTAKITDANVTTAKIAADAITGAKIADNAIDSEHYVDDSIDTAHIASSAITATEIADNAITTSKVINNGITNAKIASASVNTSELIDNAVTTAKITDDAITQAKVADNSIGNAQMLNDAVSTAEITDNAITNAKMANNAIGTSEIVNDAVTTDKIADNAVTTAKFGDDVITNAKIADNAVNTLQIVDNAITSAKIAGTSIDSTKLTNNTIITAAEQSSSSVNDTSFLSSAASDGRYFRQSSAETILDGATWQSSDAYIASTAAIDDRIVDLVDDVGGFVPIANETSFPTTNPDVNNGAGTLVSIKALASNLTSNGSGIATIANAAGSGNTVTINGLANSTTYAATYGMIVETTSTTHTYTFHRQVPKATEVTTVAGSISNVNTVAGSISNVNSVASNATNINTTAGSISNVNTVGGSISNVNTAATNISSINDFADKYRIASSAPTSNNDEGDLYYNTSDDKLYMYNGSAWVQAVTSTADLTTDAELAAWTGSTNVTTLGTVGTGTWQGTAIASGYIAADAITGAKIADDAINSEHYTDGSIDTAHIADNQITNAKMADDAIGTAELSASGTASSSTFLRGDNSWQTIDLTNLDASNLTSGTVNAARIGSDTITGGKIADDSIDSEHIADNAITNTQVSSSAAIAGTKISPDFGSQNVVTTGTLGSGAITTTGDLTISSIYPQIKLTDTNNDDDFEIRNADGIFIVRDATNSADRLSINSSGATSIGGNLTVIGNVQVGNDKEIIAGGSSELKIWHDDDNSYIKNSTGDLYIQGDGDDLYLRAADDITLYTQTSDKAIECIGDGGVKLYHDGNALRLNTESWGVTIGGDIKIATDNHILLGDGNQLAIEHNTDGNSVISESGSGRLLLKGSGIRLLGASNENLIHAEAGSSTQLYHNNRLTLETQTNGVQVQSPDSEAKLRIKSLANDGAASLELIADNGEDNPDFWQIAIAGAGGDCSIQNYASGGWANSLTMTEEGATKLYYDGGTAKLETLDTGVRVNDWNFELKAGSGSEARLNIIGDAGAQNNDLSRITSYNGVYNWETYESGSWANMIECVGGAATKLFYNGGTAKLETTNTGVSVAGGIAATGTITSTSTASGTPGVRKITTSTSAPSGGADGDVWIKYTA